MFTRDPCPDCGLYDLTVVPGPFGPHHAKRVCAGCGRFAAWIPAPTSAQASIPADVAALVVPRAEPDAVEEEARAYYRLLVQEHS